MFRTIVFASLALAGAARAETLTGAIDEPSLRRKVDLVYVQQVDGQFAPPPAGALLNQRGNTFVPHLLPILDGTKVTFQSEDPELHNVYARGTKRVLFNDAVLPHMKTERVFNGVGVVHLSCNIHKEMSAYVMVVQNPYWVQPDRKTGAFTIKGIAPGTYTVRIWGEALSDEQNARQFVFTVGANATPLKIAAR